MKSSRANLELFFASLPNIVYNISMETNNENTNNIENTEAKDYSNPYVNDALELTDDDRKEYLRRWKLKYYQSNKE